MRIHQIIEGYGGAYNLCFTIDHGDDNELSLHCGDRSTPDFGWYNDKFTLVYEE